MIEETIARAVCERLTPQLDELRTAVAELAARQAPALIPLLDRAGLAAFLGCGVRTVDHYRNSGCPYVRLGGPKGSPRFVADEVLQWLRDAKR